MRHTRDHHGPSTSASTNSRALVLGSSARETASGSGGPDAGASGGASEALDCGLDEGSVFGLVVVRAFRGGAAGVKRQKKGGPLVAGPRENGFMVPIDQFHTFVSGEVAKEAAELVKVQKAEDKQKAAARAERKKARAVAARQAGEAAENEERLGGGLFDAEGQEEGGEEGGEGRLGVRAL